MPWRRSPNLRQSLDRRLVLLEVEAADQVLDGIVRGVRGRLSLEVGAERDENADGGHGNATHNVFNVGGGEQYKTSDANGARE